MKVCANCGGKGVVEKDCGHSFDGGRIIDTSVCVQCRGTGWTRSVDAPREAFVAQDVGAVLATMTADVDAIYREHLLRSVAEAVFERDHLRVQNGELQTSNTALLERARKAERELAELIERVPMLQRCDTIPAPAEDESEERLAVAGDYVPDDVGCYPRPPAGQLVFHSCGPSSVLGSRLDLGAYERLVPRYAERHPFVPGAEFGGIDPDPRGRSLAEVIGVDDDEPTLGDEVVP